MPALANPAAAAEPSPSYPRIHASVSAWESTGSTTWSHDASMAEPRLGDPTSRLEYDDVDSTIAELRLRIELSERYAVELAHGGGTVSDGRLTDSDFVSARGAEFFGTTVEGAHAFSRTESALNGDDVRYLDARLERTLISPARGRTGAGVALRYLHWTERQRARGVGQTVCTAPGTLCMPRGFSGFRDRDVVLNEARWQALFIGVWASRELTDRVRVAGEIFYSPLARLRSNDRHFLRADLAQSPSFRLEGYGQAASARIDAEFRITSRLSAGVGLQYWWAAITDEAGGFTVFPAGGPPAGARLNRFQTDRYGATASLTYTFGR